jgi:hypothetical protein
MMECCERTEADKKGGHLAKRNGDGQLVLRESAQCAKEDSQVRSGSALRVSQFVYGYVLAVAKRYHSAPMDSFPAPMRHRMFRDSECRLLVIGFP